jgi:hypothetical protein
MQTLNRRADRQGAEYASSVYRLLKGRSSRIDADTLPLSKLGLLSRACQRAHWKLHKEECESLEKETIEEKKNRKALDDKEEEKSEGPNGRTVLSSWLVGGRTMHAKITSVGVCRRRGWKTEVRA